MLKPRFLGDALERVSTELMWCIGRIKRTLYALNDCGQGTGAQNIVITSLGSSRGTINMP